RSPGGPQLRWRLCVHARARRRPSQVDEPSGERWLPAPAPVRSATSSRAKWLAERPAIFACRPFWGGFGRTVDAPLERPNDLVRHAVASTKDLERLRQGL